MTRVRLATLQYKTATVAAVATPDGFAPIDAPDVGALLGQPDWRRLADIAIAGSARVPAAEANHRPVVVAPRKVVCCGHNYADHIAELGKPRPEFPTLFAKFADTLTGAFDDISLPPGSERADWEAELAIVVGTSIARADRDEASAAIAGYSVANDISMRDWQSRTLQWLQGKAFDGTTPIGPVVVTADELDPASGLEISCSIGNDVVQRDSTASLVFDAASLVAYISQFTKLGAGDIILTGTPGGVGAARTPPRFLRDGDVVTTTIEGIGTMTNLVRIADPALTKGTP